MRVIPIVNRLKQNVPLVEKRVEPSKALIALPDDEVEYGIPISFVNTEEEKAKENETIGAVEQELPKYFKVMHCAPNVDIDKGEEPLEDLRDETHQALLGWQPDEKHGPVEFVSGKVLDISTRYIWWVDLYKTETNLCGE